MKRFWTNPVATCVIAGGLLCVAVPAFSLDLKSKLQMHPSGIKRAMPSLKRTFFWSEWNGFVAPREAPVDPQREFAVVLTGSGKPQASTSNRSWKYWGGDFYPRVFVARSGVSFEIKNEDIFPHKPTSDSKDAQSALGDLLLGSGSAKPVTPAVPLGAVVKDASHPHVEGFLHVIPDLVAVATLEGDNFIFTGLEAGTYQLNVFHKDKRVLTQSVDVQNDLELPVVQLPKIE